jgi:hypothetical protein
MRYEIKSEFRQGYTGKRMSPGFFAPNKKPALLVF